MSPKDELPNELPCAEPYEQRRERTKTEANNRSPNFLLRDSNGF